MDFSQAIIEGFKNYVKFSGRASRSEFWYWVLFIVIVSVALTILDMALFPAAGWSPLSTVWSILTIVPAISINARRLHDIDRSGWWLLLELTVIGALLILFWACLKGTAGPNRFGADPLAGTAPITQPG